MKIVLSKQVMSKLFDRYYLEDLLERLNPFPAVRGFFRKTIKGFRWFTFSWGVYWFDYTYIEQTLAWLLRYMGKKFIKDGHCEGAKQRGEEMLFVADRLRKLSDGVIEEDICLQHVLLFPNKPKDFFDIEKDKLGNHIYKESKAMKSYRKTPEGKREEKAFRTILQRIEEANQKEREAIYAYIAKNIRNWWD